MLFLGLDDEWNGGGGCRDAIDSVMMSFVHFVQCQQPLQL
jgi:hypothetical protein